LEDELAAAQMAMHNLLGTCADVSLGAQTQDKVAAFEQKLLQVSQSVLYLSPSLLLLLISADI
jgi:hypothetical protein